jgi:hypothetical protein
MLQGRTKRQAAGQGQPMCGVEPGDGGKGDGKDVQG